MQGIRWGRFEQEAPDLAANVRELIDDYRFAFVGTLRRDGTPRISSIETHLVGDDLMLVMLPETRKAADVRRDSRIVLQSPITNAGDPGLEFKIRGSALAVTDESQRAATADAIESYSGWRPGASWLFLATLLADVTCFAWRTDGTASLSRWSVRDGLRETVQLRLDMAAGGYHFD